ncbi:hypothetical protein AVEN_228095-1 [Araneus ventricosus]|uniref:Uncharacterized protein n=1 Tax=Araneus ventricosus TaxID=182803 RepID=A0A4Y2M475_ARAVE|nr:hypothetical protein AVEN_228095-1 [Araneus ventricosus]
MVCDLTRTGPHAVELGFEPGFLQSRGLATSCQRPLQLPASWHPHITVPDSRLLLKPRRFFAKLKKVQGIVKNCTKQPLKDSQRKFTEERHKAVMSTSYLAAHGRLMLWLYCRHNNVLLSTGRR